MILLPKPRRAEDWQEWAERLVAILEPRLGPRLEVPVGTIIAYASDIVPDGWLVCDGFEHRIADFPALGRYLGDLWGAASDSEHFLVPDLTGKVLVGGSPGVGGEVEAGTGVPSAAVMYLVKA